MQEFLCNIITIDTHQFWIKFSLMYLYSLIITQQIQFSYFFFIFETSSDCAVSYCTWQDTTKYTILSTNIYNQNQNNKQIILQNLFTVIFFINSTFYLKNIIYIENVNILLNEYSTTADQYTNINFNVNLINTLIKREIT